MRSIERIRALNDRFKAKERGKFGVSPAAISANDICIFRAANVITCVTWAKENMAERGAQIKASRYARLIKFQRYAGVA